MVGNLQIYFHPLSNMHVGEAAIPLYSNFSRTWGPFSWLRDVNILLLMYITCLHSPSFPPSPLPPIFNLVDIYGRCYSRALL